MTIDFSKLSGGTITTPTILDSVVLTDKEVYPYRDGAYAKEVTYTRTFNNGVYNSLCLPCDLYYDDEMYGAISIYKFDSFRLNGDRVSSNPTTKFRKYDTIPAGTPLIIIPNSDDLTYTFHGDNRKGYVRLEPYEGKPNKNTKPQWNLSCGIGTVKFYRIWELTTRGDMEQDIYYLAKNGTLSRGSKDTASVNSYRWIFTYDGFV